MKTLKLYWENPYFKKVKANILSIDTYEKDPTKYVITLDKTIFYPEGGGQPSDQGKIDDAKVLYVYEQDNIIYHVVDKVPKKKDDVFCTLDWNRRFDFMQQHLGQHILTYAFINLYKANTIGFHLGDEIVTIDIDKSTLNDKDMETVEIYANEIIYKNLEVKSLFPTKEELANMPLVKKPSVDEDIRIIEIDGLDYTPCGGTHPKYTGSVGIIKIRKWENYKGNIRIEFICGKRCIQDFQWKNQQINNIANILSVKDIEVEDTVVKMYHNNKELNKSIKDYKKIILDYQVDKLYADAEKVSEYYIVLHEFNGEDMQDIMYISNSLSKYPNVISLLGTKNNLAQVVFSCSKDVPIKMNKLFKEFIFLIDGKGGGNATSAQGGGKNINNLSTFLKSAKTRVIEKLS